MEYLVMVSFSFAAGSAQIQMEYNGAASLSELSQSGVKRNGSKFSVTVPEMVVAGVIEIIPCTEKAVNSINAVPVWTA